MVKNKHMEGAVVEQLNKKHDIRVHGTIVECLRGAGAKNDIGIKSRGKIDFLVHYCGYVSMWSTAFSQM